MRYINKENNYKDLPLLNPSLGLKNNNIYRGLKLNNEEGINTDIDLQFDIAGIKFGMEIESIYKDTDDVITIYAGYNFHFGNFCNTISYSKRYLTATDSKSEEITLETDYLRNQDGPTYTNKLSYDIDTNDYINILSVSADNVLGFNGSISYGYNTMKDSSGNENPNYIQVDVCYPMLNYELCGSFVKQLEGDEDEITSFGGFYQSKLGGIHNFIFTPAPTTLA